MSSQTLEARDELATTNGGDAPVPTRVYRGRDLAELLPQIRSELGADAIVIRQREGLKGGFAGFFAQRFVEIEAMSGSPRIDLYDDELEQMWEAPAAGDTPAQAWKAVSESAVAAAPVAKSAPSAVQAAPAVPALPVAASEPDDQVARAYTFAARLASAGGVEEREIATPVAAAPVAALPAAAAPVAGAPVAGAPVAGAPVAGAPVAGAPVAAALPPVPTTAGRGISRRDAMAVVVELAGRGMSVELADALVSQAAAHELPFAPGGDLRHAVRAVIARRLPRHQPAPADDTVVAVVGAADSGKTRCVANLAAAYASAGHLSVTCLALASSDNGAGLRGLLAGHDVVIEAASDGSGALRQLREAPAGLFVLDTPSVWPADTARVATLADQLGALAPDEVLLAVPATLSALDGHHLLEAMAPLAPTALVATHADEDGRLGVAVELACTSGTPLAYVNEGSALRGALRPADPAQIAARLLP